MYSLVITVIEPNADSEPLVRVMLVDGAGELDGAAV